MSSQLTDGSNQEHKGGMQMADDDPTRIIKKRKPGAGQKIRDLTGETFGHWSVLRFDKFLGEKPNRKAMWLVRCDCGSERSVWASNLTRGLSTNCGCKREKIGTSTYASEYSSYRMMKSRCLDPHAKDYPRYGGRGITICARWRGHAFPEFIADMGPKPEPKDDYQIERKDNESGGYWCGHCDECISLGHPANCIWATQTEQARNRRNNRFIELDGIRATISEHAERLGISPSNLWHQLDLRGFKDYSHTRRKR